MSFLKIQRFYCSIFWSQIIVMQYRIGLLTIFQFTYVKSNYFLEKNKDWLTDIQIIVDLPARGTLPIISNLNVAKQKNKKDKKKIINGFSVA